MSAATPDAAAATPKDPLQGLTLEKLLRRLVRLYGWEELSRFIRIRCFTDNPSVKSSLTFLRRTPWARQQVEDFYRAYGHADWVNAGLVDEAG
ncbi:MAG: VF530 family protein [Moraxellaceae bacterium]|nr:VF530 family protein [Moraxellaceae bacterium]